MIQSIGGALEKLKDTHTIDRFARSQVKDLFLGLGRDDRLVYGHAHRTFIDGSAANVGCWVSDATVQNTYIKIENGETQLLQYVAE